MRKILILIFLFVMVGFVGQVNPIPTLEHDHYKELNTKNVILAMGNLGIEKPGIVLRQIKLETGNLKYTAGNNLFGFRTNKHMTFDNWYSSVEYYKNWQERKGYDSGDYYKFIKKVKYAEDPKYIKKLQKIEHTESELFLLKFFNNGK